MYASHDFTGSRRKLVLAFDVGTTYSGISYSILDPGQVPEIRGVTKFPANEHVGGSSKIPTVIYYDQSGNVRAVGAEAMREGIQEIAEDEQWIKAEWFKLHLRSKFGQGQAITDEIPPLPLNKSVVEVLSDFLKYLFDCASSFIQATHANGADLWESISTDINFVLSHPNGWEGTEQIQMRNAAVLAGLILDNSSGHARLSFVTEGEASLHFAIQNGLPDGAMKRGEGLVIVDAGGGTIDVSSYTKSSALGSTFEEIAAPQCYFSGSVFVTMHARHFLQSYLSESPFLDDIDHIIRCFDKTTKLRFKNADEPQYVKFGSTRDNDPTYNIRFGQLKISGSDTASFFQPSIDCVVNAVLGQQRTAQKPISHVILVGGFAASDWLYTRVQATLEASGLTVMVPNSHVNKAVSDGAISFYLNHFVRTRISKFTYGVFCSVLFNPNNPDHRNRSSNSFHSVSGNRRIGGRFDVILPKNTQVLETKGFTQSYTRTSTTKSAFSKSVFDIMCYRGRNPNPMWKDIDPDNYTRVCFIEVDLSGLPMVPKFSAGTRKHYFRIEYDIVLLFGLTELRAQIVWMEKGVEKQSPAKIIYDHDSTEDGA
ncbi:hypothetical protein GALMADRAFT_254436 [Galerina marginata CBS 339.88]|uniref:Uncharacterized protein n=1 Tax=Galerina marginata (strain CBS 339.88) TaxID=685588 RepID=A0A067SVL7_GALM3|nr:hypothetical protein GALMADRAFT_254436 [Galerina marginata CBS 339.88]